MKINLLVKGLDGTGRVISIDQSATLEEFKQTAEDIFGVTDYYLSCLGKILNDDSKTLKEYGMKKNMSGVQILRRIWGEQSKPKNKCNSKINLFVKGPDWMGKVISIDELATLNEFKQTVEEAFEVTDYYLTCLGKIINDDSKTLKECGMKNNSLVQILKRIISEPSKSPILSNSKISLFVKGPDWSKKILNINPSSTINEFKQTAEDTFGFTIDWIVYKGITLNDESKTLSECNIKDKSFVQIWSIIKSSLSKLSEDKKPKITVFIKGTDGVKRTLEVDGSATFEEFEQQVKKDLDIIVKRAVFGGKIITDKTKTLSEYEIKNKSQIQIIEKLAGGLNFII